MTLATLPSLRHRSQAGLHETTTVRDGADEYFITAAPRPNECWLATVARAAEHTQLCRARPLAMTVINGGPEQAAGLGVIQRALGPVSWPISWIDSETPAPASARGIEIHALAGPVVKPIRVGGRAVGAIWEDALATHCELGDLRDPETSKPASEQAQFVFDLMTAALAQAGMNFQHVYRTWFRNHDILAWYNDFNRVRTAYYTQAHVFDGLLPASTGIGATNPFGAALIAGLWAMRPKSTGARAHVVPSPLQNPAPNYGSSFSRAIEAECGDHRLLTISGTASIDPDGKTIHVGDTRAQIELTMKVVEAILLSRGMHWSSVSRAIAYFRHAEETPLWGQWMAASGVADLPVIVTPMTVCRNDLLFEIEVDAVGEKA